jgi:2-polyprenyl-3-methyl-5-hydroxy-6-metoxy-1,4-benzoquinol methylase
MTDADHDKWEQKYAAKDVSEAPAPDEWMLDCVRSLKPGRALDVACGLGQNSIALAKLGWQVDAVDISPCGLKLASQQADQRGVTVNWICADLDGWLPDVSWYDLVIVFRFLDWDRVPAIVERGLKPGGSVCYETFSASQMNRADNHLKNPAFTVQEGDWERYFPDFEVLLSETVSLQSGDVARLRAVRKS